MDSCNVFMHLINSTILYLLHHVESWLDICHSYLVTFSSSTWCTIQHFLKFQIVSFIFLISLQISLTCSNMNCHSCSFLLSYTCGIPVCSIERVSFSFVCRIFNKHSITQGSIHDEFITIQECRNSNSRDNQKNLKAKKKNFEFKLGQVS